MTDDSPSAVTPVRYAYLDQQFSDVDAYFKDLREWVSTGEFTIGPYVEAFEQKFAEYIGVKYAVGTNTGTGALILALRAAGIGRGDEVITVPNTFVATVGAIVAVGATPVFVDCDDRYQIDVDRIPAAVTSRTKAIVPVHWAGCPCDIERVMDIASEHQLKVVEDACPAVGAKVNGRCVGTFGHVNAFSMHPLKPLNVWGDGGIVVTNDKKTATWLRLYRNHGLTDRDHVTFWGVNERLQPVQAIIASRLLDSMETLIARRNENARQLDEGLRDLVGHISPPDRPPKYREVYQLYLVRATRRDALMEHLTSRGVECRVHYPIPLHLQDAAKDLGYRVGSFPACEQQASEILTIPAHQHVTRQQLDYVLECVHAFYRE